MRVTIAVLLMTFMTGNCQGECLTQFTPNYYKANNRALLHHVYQAKTTSSAAICGRDCSMDPQCASFNYHESRCTNSCQMNNITRNMDSSIFVELQGSAYFDNNYETSFLSVPDTVNFQSCQMLLQAGHCDSGIYTIYPLGMSHGIQVYCDMTTAGGGWIVFQRRQDGSVDFYRDWADYQSGFGNLLGEFWLGNENIQKITENGQWKLHVDVVDWAGMTAWAEYDNFGIIGDKYILNISSYNGMSTAGDSLTVHNAQQFTTKDQDNDAESSENCAQKNIGAWWFTACFLGGSHLNGKYHNQGSVNHGQGIQWYQWTGDYRYSLQECSMKIREVL